MTLIGRMAEVICGTSFDVFSRTTVNNVKMHFIDSLGAMIAGGATREGRSVRELAKRLWPGGDMPVVGFPGRGSMLSGLVTTCAAARSTETDDIHLGSCTTPGSVIVPAALAFAPGALSDPRDFLAAICLGYDAIVRVGMAIDGAHALYRGIWPTYFAAAIGSATVASRALNLDAERTAHALAAALMMSTGTSGRVKSALPFRWLTLGVAAQNGVIAAMGAKEGMDADLSLLDRESGPMAALFVRRDEISDRLGERFLIDETGMKPFTTARQALSAIEAFRQIVHEDGVEPTSIREVKVLVPASYAGMIDNRNLPETRMESIVGVQYQMSQAALHPARLLDVLHEPSTEDPRIAKLMACIRVEGSAELERLFPLIWPARVEVLSEAGTYVREVLHPKGDAQNPLMWEELASKFGWVAGPFLGQEKAGFVCAQARKMEGTDKMEPFLRLVTDDGKPFTPKNEGGRQ